MDAVDKLLELDDRHNELLEQLAQLDAKISEALNDWVSEMTPQLIPVPEKMTFPVSRIKAA